MQSTSTSASTTSIPRNYASTHLRVPVQSATTNPFPNTCFDLSDLLSFAILHPVDSFNLDGDTEECPSTTPCSEAEDDEADVLELTYSRATGKSTGTLGSGTSSVGMERGMGRDRGTDDVIEEVIKRLEGYELGHKRKEKGKGIAENGQEISGTSVKPGIGPAIGIISDQDCMLWTRVWGSATAVKNARERRGRRLGRKIKATMLSFET